YTLYRAAHSLGHKPYFVSRTKLKKPCLSGLFCACYLTHNGA
ncbi:MAG: hypothetical protein ACI9S7_001697, partial [Candidatus Paceibacteria bacterium]